MLVHVTTVIPNCPVPDAETLKGYSVELGRLVVVLNVGGFIDPVSEHYFEKFNDYLLFPARECPYPDACGTSCECTVTNEWFMDEDDSDRFAFDFPMEWITVDV